jgi:peptide/nickel transport system substrate-binding protein
MKKRRLAGAAAVLALLVAAASGCTSVSSTSDAQKSAGKPVLTIGFGSSANTLNPATEGAGGAPPEQISSLSYAPIIHLAPNGTLQPGLATSWHYVGSGNKVFEFTLRHDARFSDGTPVTAGGVAKWLTYFVHAGGDSSLNLGLKTATTQGPWTVVLHLGAPNPIVPLLLSEFLNVGFVASPTAAAHPAQLNTATDGAGPYVEVPSQSVSNSQYTFVPNKYYYDKSAIHWSKVVVKIITSPSTALEAIQSGQLDVSYGDITTVKAARSAGLGVVSAPYGWAGMLIMDRGPKLPDGSGPNPLANVKVRQALNYAIDRKTIVQSVLGGEGTPSSEAGTVDGFDPAYQNYYPYDPAKAKSLLAAAGYPHGLTLKVDDQTYIGALGDPILEAMAKYFSAVGVKLNISQATTGPDFTKGIFGGAYQATGFVQSPMLPMYQFYNYYLGPGVILNQHGWDDPALDKLWKTGAAAQAPDPYWKAMSQRAVTQAVEVPVLLDKNLWYARKGIGGVTFSAVSGVPLPVDWYAK